MTSKKDTTLSSLSFRLASMNVHDHRAARSVAFALGLAVVAMGCAGSVKSRPAHGPKLTHAPASSSGEKVVAKSDAREVVRPATATVGPYLAFRPHEALAVYAVDEGKGLAWWARPLDSRGRVTNKEAVRLSPLGQEPGFAVLRPSSAGYVMIWTEGQPGEEKLYIQAIEPSGAARAPAKLVTRTEGHLLWTDYLATDSGALLAWSVQSTRDATISVMPVGDGHAPSGAAVEVARNVLAWDAKGSSNGAAIVTVATTRRHSNLGHVQLLRLSGDGHVVRRSDVWKKDTARSLVRLVRAGGRWVVGWTNYRQGNDTLTMAAVGGDDERPLVVTPMPWTENQTLVDLASGASGRTFALVARGPRTEACRNVTTMVLDRDLRPARYWTTVSSRVDRGPWIVPTAHGAILLTQDGRCSAGGDAAPVVGLLDGAGRAVQSGELLSGTTGPMMAWSPGCTNDSCFALVATHGSPVHIETVPLKPQRADPKVTFVEDTNEPLRVVRSGTLLTHHEPLAALDAVPLDHSLAVAWLSRFEGPIDPKRKPPRGAPGNPRKPMEAQLGLLLVSPDSNHRVQHRTWISVRARTDGGVALAPNRAKSGEVCAAWTARDGRFEQVFLTRIDEQGKRRLQRMVSRGPHHARGVSLTAAADGWFVGWIDRARGKQPYRVQKVGQSLLPVGPRGASVSQSKERVEAATILAEDEKRLWAAYATGKSGAHPNSVQLLALDASTLRPKGPALHVATATGVGTIRLRRTSTELFVAWTSTSSAPKEPTAAHVVVVDPTDGRVVREEHVPGSNPRQGLGLWCEKDRCRGAVDLGAGPHTTILRAFRWTKDEEAGRDLLQVPRARSVSPVIVGSTLLYLGTSGDGRPQVRWADVAWSR